MPKQNSAVCHATVCLSPLPASYFVLPELTVPRTNTRNNQPEKEKQTDSYPLVSQLLNAK